MIINSYKPLSTNVVPSLDGRGKGRVDGYGVIMVRKDNSGRITVAFQYDPLLVEKVKTIEGRKWHNDKRVFWQVSG